jgi:hypothetical protein
MRIGVIEDGGQPGLVGRHPWATLPAQNLLLTAPKSGDAGSMQALLLPPNHLCGMQVGANQPSSPVSPDLTVMVRPILAAK